MPEKHERKKPGGLVKSFAYALKGFGLCIRTERNMRVHLSIALLVVFFGGAGRIEPWAWAVILICFALVMGFETVNTAIEQLCDRVTSDTDEAIRDVKDKSAGAVLVCTMGAAGVGLVIFCRKAILITVYGAFRSFPALWAVLGVVCVILIFFIRGKK